MDLLVELANIIRAFNEDEIDYALCGGLALAVYAKPRATLDIDIMVHPDFLDKVKQKAEKLGIADKVFKIDAFLEKIFSEHPDLVDYKVLNVQKKQFGYINLNDDFFVSLKEDYNGFDKWFIKKSDDFAYVTTNKTNGLILSFLYLKVENKEENYTDRNL